MPRKECADAGHCWHFENGELYQRHVGQEAGTAPCQCCWCGNTRHMVTGSRGTAPSLGVSTIEHGRMVQYVESVRLRVVPCDECAALNLNVPKGALGPERCKRHTQAREVA